MLVSIMGSTCTWCQIPALREGFAALGHTHTDDWTDPNVAFVFVGNSPYEPYLEAARNRSKKIIFNCLDIPIHTPDGHRWINEWKMQLADATRVTSISAYTQSQLLTICGIQSDVIYYPMKPISRMGGAPKYPQYKFLLCGRVNDRNKRFHVALGAILGAGFDKSQVAIVGPENPGWGCYLGVVDDEALNDLYNSVDYVMMPSFNEGIGLVGVEGACAGAIPIILPDLSTYDELWAGSPMGLFYQTFKDVESIEQFLIYMDENPAEKQIMKDAMYAYAQTHFVPKFSAIEVAKRIIGVYHSI